jgi:hypothetical protein
MLAVTQNFRYEDYYYYYLTSDILHFSAWQSCHKSLFTWLVLSSLGLSRCKYACPGALAVPSAPKRGQQGDSEHLFIMANCISHSRNHCQSQPDNLTQSENSCNSRVQTPAGLLWYQSPLFSRAWCCWILNYNSIVTPVKHSNNFQISMTLSLLFDIHFKSLYTENTLRPVGAEPPRT